MSSKRKNNEKMKKKDTTTISRLDSATSGSFFQTITFQNIIVNIAIMVAFIVFSIMATAGINSVKAQAMLANTNQLQLANEAAVLKQDIIHISAEINKNLGQFEAGTTFTKADFADMEGYIAEAMDKLVYMDDCLIPQNLPDGQERVQNLRATVEAFTTTATNLENCIVAGDLPGAISYVSQDYGTSLDNVYAALASIEDGIVQLNDGFGAYLDVFINEQMSKGYFLMAIVVILIVASFVLTYVRVNKTIRSMSNEIQSIIKNIDDGKGDLTARLNTKTNTELGLISGGINKFLSTLQGVIKDVKDGAGVLTAASDRMIVKIQSASDNVTNTSAAMEELAASMENVATTSDDLNERLSVVREAAEAIDTEAKAGAEMANDIKEEADAIKRDANSKKESTGAKMEELSKVLEVSVQESEQVDKIGDLTNEILDIASQTNLLALNASIEAARAGEAGKGFAVVADEISKLASNSRDTAGNIQEISGKVTAAVKTLSDNAVQVIDFINNNVLTDYDAFVETGSKYEETATKIDEMLEKFSEKADNLNSVMNEMADRIESISCSVQESSNAISLSASSASEIVSEIQGINDAMDQNNDVTKQLNASTQKFEIV